MELKAAVVETSDSKRFGCYTAGITRVVRTLPMGTPTTTESFQIIIHARVLGSPIDRTDLMALKIVIEEALK